MFDWENNTDSSKCHIPGTYIFLWAGRSRALSTSFGKFEATINEVVIYDQFSSLEDAKIAAQDSAIRRLSLGLIVIGHTFAAVDTETLNILLDSLIYAQTYGLSGVQDIKLQISNELARRSRA